MIGLASKLHCLCATPIFSVNARGIELERECGEKTSIRFEELAGLRHLIDLQSGGRASRGVPRDR